MLRIEDWLKSFLIINKVEYFFINVSKSRQYLQYKSIIILFTSGNLRGYGSEVY